MVRLLVANGIEVTFMKTFIIVAEYINKILTIIRLYYRYKILIRQLAEGENHDKVKSDLQMLCLWEHC